MANIILKDISTRAPKDINKEKIVQETQEMVAKIQYYQYKMAAEEKKSLLIVFQ